jgi:hypothetical protein
VKPRFANPRDGNEERLLKVAATLGGEWLEQGPLDGWVVWRGTWRPVEIKLPEREGLVHEYTPAQKRFFGWCRTRSAKWLTWRTEADVIRDLGGRVVA